MISGQSLFVHHILHDVCKVRSISAVIGDNASTQSGAKGQAVELGRLFSSFTVFVGCYPHILNIALCNGMSEGLGQRGTMVDFNLFQLHYKVGYIHHQRPTYYKALYVSEQILAKAPPLPQEFVETRWSYIHESLKWWAKHGTACVKLGKKMLERLPVSESHHSIWSNVVATAANDRLTAQRTMLLELLDRLKMPGLEMCQAGDTELNFSSGYLARMWPRKTSCDINMAQLMLDYPCFALPLTENSKAALSSSDQEIFSRTHKAMYTNIHSWVNPINSSTKDTRICRSTLQQSGQHCPDVEVCQGAHCCLLQGRSLRPPAIPSRQPKPTVVSRVRALRTSCW